MEATAAWRSRFGLEDGGHFDIAARKVIEFAQRGVSDRVDLREKVLEELSYGFAERQFGL